MNRAEETALYGNCGCTNYANYQITQTHTPPYEQVAFIGLKPAIWFSKFDLEHVYKQTQNK